MEDDSEVEAQGGLERSRRVHDAVAATSGDTKEVVCWIAASCAEGVTIEGIRDVKLEHDYLGFSDCSSLDDGKILILIFRTSPPTNNRGISKEVSASPRHRRCTGIEVSRAVGRAWSNRRPWWGGFG